MAVLHGWMNIYPAYSLTQSALVLRGHLISKIALPKFIQVERGISVKYD
tara:strand:+ start:346 stop:492 length:147 start_codon:yes stop_codon:yes gene_type:complete